MTDTTDVEIEVVDDTSDRVKRATRAACAAIDSVSVGVALDTLDVALAAADTKRARDALSAAAKAHDAALAAYNDAVAALAAAAAALDAARREHVKAIYAAAKKEKVL